MGAISLAVTSTPERASSLTILAWPEDDGRPTDEVVILFYRIYFALQDKTSLSYDSRILEHRLGHFFARTPSLRLILQPNARQFAML